MKFEDYYGERGLFLVMVVPCPRCTGEKYQGEIPCGHCDEYGNVFVLSPHNPNPLFGD